MTVKYLVFDDSYVSPMLGKSIHDRRFTMSWLTVIKSHAYELFSADLMGRVRLTSNINALQLAFARCEKNGLPNNTHDIHRIADSR